MSPVSRGIRNAFRNGVRTLSIIIILGLSIGLCLTMLVANKAVSNKIASVKSAIGTTVTISPAGFNPGSQANNALTTSELSKVKALAHVTDLTETVNDRLSTTGSSQSSFGFGGAANSNSSTTSLTSPVKLNTSGRGGGAKLFVNGGASLPTNFSLPITFLGTNDPSSLDGSSLSLSSGKAIDGNADSNDALISTSMASKNNLQVGSTFTAYNQTLTVAGIFKTSNQGSEGTVILSLPAEQRLSGQSGSVTSAVATVDSLDNLSSATSAIKSALGSSADVVSSEEQADNTVKPLNSVKTVSFFSLIGAVVAGGIIILLSMVMIVRERKREIGVVKAIGGSNLRIMAEFMVEALTLTVVGAVIGLLIGVIAGQPVTNTLVSNSTTSTTTSGQGPGGFGQRAAGGGGQAGPVRVGGFGGRLGNNGAVRGLKNINAEIGWGILLDGFGAAVLIAVLGSALAAGMISKVRPSETLRSA
ncbi:MAG TPA: FtsX-like permease family protein [Candidatus Saccharimonadales bacterium]|nr:FtsX-like permease family protein [Candidatus Saccharimonadales bacterium]